MPLSASRLLRPARSCIAAVRSAAAVSERSGRNLHSASHGSVLGTREPSRLEVVPAVDEILEPYVTSYLSLPIVTDWSDGFPVREIAIDEQCIPPWPEKAPLRPFQRHTKISRSSSEGRSTAKGQARSIRGVTNQDGVQIGQAAIDESVGLDPLNVNVLMIARGFAKWRRDSFADPKSENSGAPLQPGYHSLGPPTDGD